MKPLHVKAFLITLANMKSQEDTASQSYYLRLVTPLSLPARDVGLSFSHTTAQTLKVTQCPPRSDLSAEQEVTRQLHEWNKSAFGGLFDHLRKRYALPSQRPHTLHSRVD
jgi:hypothetical protein